MGILLAASAITVFGFTWAKFQGPRGIDSLNQFSNAAGVLTRVLTVFDALRQIAIWFNAGKQGAGPLSVPMPAKTMAPQPTSRPSMSLDDLYIGDPVGKDLGLPPKMNTPAATFP
jgi:hypothetical protein